MYKIQFRNTFTDHMKILILFNLRAKGNLLKRNIYRKDIERTCLETRVLKTNWQS